VRTIANDLGEKIGCGAHLSALRRTATDRFNIAQAVPLAQLETMEHSAIRSLLLSAYEAAPGHVVP
jgi:tRNA pseudouridine55 synthase